ncbi:MAG TPA: aminomethyl-transferring glycine dehydrogenase [Acidimicrobiia bacterium]|nr:aminomethyl-transferring glycine dehydrogenase [Acidimicrobiia bacterium]
MRVPLQYQPEGFAARHLGPDPDDVAKMLVEVGSESVDQLLAKTIPASIRLDRPLQLPEPLDEQEVLGELANLAGQNRIVTSLIGLGFYDTYTPPVIQRNVLENPAWYTAYTPYQPEISQGRLEVLLSFQTMVADLTGLEIANASLLDEASAAAEAMAMCRRLSTNEGNVFYVDPECHPQTIAVVQTRAGAVGVEVRVAKPAEFVLEDSFGLLLAYPASTGGLADHTDLITLAHAAGAVVAVATDLLALTILKPPGEMGADIAVGSAQRFGVPMAFGGPHAGFIATRESMVRALPGRLVGVARDSAGRTAFRLALQTREQHIRRQRATSNVCTAQVLLAVMAALYACWHGPEGLRAIARRVQGLAGRLAAAARAAGLTLANDTWFDTVTITVPGGAEAAMKEALVRGLNLRRVSDDQIGVSFDETSTDATLAAVLEALAIDPADGGDDGSTGFERQGEILAHPVFHLYRTEHEMLRYLRRLADRDLALDRTMIPLGSCTMKLNATAEMIPITWPGFARLHPFAPLDQASGYVALFERLEGYLTEITGYDRVSLQPNAGSQGELAGLLAIRAYHRQRGEGDRNICLIPASAHGTNAASAVMAGMEVVVVATDEAGNVDLADLESKATEYSSRLAAVMITYPSTHGVFEEGVRHLCDIIHSHGGQVYVDGANLNAMVGLARPADFGADVSHLNLHKTFTIPHGGGGPGVGPIGVRSHLAPFLPNHPLLPEAGPETGIGPVASAPFGSAGILPIAYAYIRLMGERGLRAASAIAILNANYLASRLQSHFPILYTGSAGRVAHECILDLRPLTKTTGVTAEDVAKRLADYGFHAPTLSFPVAGTLMVEPTESESLRELDRFCEAMIAIRGEIDEISQGKVELGQSPLRNAPHTAEDVVSDEWKRSYPREAAAFPLAELRQTKYWPPVSRIDGASGDRHLMCSCPPIEEYATAAS